jgi:hypothetical protein
MDSHWSSIGLALNYTEIALFSIVDKGCVEGFVEGFVDEGFVEGFVGEGFVEGFVEGASARHRTPDTRRSTNPVSNPTHREQHRLAGTRTFARTHARNATATEPNPISRLVSHDSTPPTSDTN